MLAPKIPKSGIKAGKPELKGEATTLDVITTERKQYQAPSQPTRRAPYIPQAAKKAPPVKEEVTEKRAHWTDNIIAGMFLDADYECKIIRTKNAKGVEEVTYDWHVIQGTGGKFPVSRYYIDSEGNLSIGGKVGDSIVSQIIFNDESLTKMYGNRTEAEASTVTRRRNTSVDTSQLVELCTLSYGDFNSAIKNATIEGESLMDFVTYDRRDHPFVKDGKEKIKYCGALLCHPDAVETLTTIVKQLSTGKKSFVFNI